MLAPRSSLTFWSFLGTLRGEWPFVAGAWWSGECRSDGRYIYIFKTSHTQKGHLEGVMLHQVMCAKHIISSIKDQASKVAIDWLTVFINVIFPEEQALYICGVVMGGCRVGSKKMEQFGNQKQIHSTLPPMQMGRSRWESLTKHGENRGWRRYITTRESIRLALKNWDNGRTVGKCGRRLRILSSLACCSDWAGAFWCQNMMCSFSDHPRSSLDTKQDFRCFCSPPIAPSMSQLRFAALQYALTGGV